MGHLYFGDNIDVLRQNSKDGSIDLIYLDPPFNSNANYNILYRTPMGAGEDSQVQAFKDTWSWEEDGAEDALADLSTTNVPAFKILQSVRSFLGESDMMAYLVMMAARLSELHRVLKPTGSLYLHCDQTACHYLKVLLDGLFGPKNFRTQITWKRSTSHGNVGRNYGSLADCILFYTKSDKYCWNQQYSALSEAYVTTKFNNVAIDGRRWQSVSLRNPSVRPNLQYPYLASNGKTYLPHRNGWAVGRDRMSTYDADGRLHFPAKEGGTLRLKQYLDERPGTRLQNIWDDIPAINSQAQERLGYPTQKPLALLDRIILTSSNPGDTVLDPFCGCGTSIHAAESHGREWVGIDVAYAAIQVIEDRLKTYFPKSKYEVGGIPSGETAARALAARDPFTFQQWAVGCLGGRPRGKGADRGIDGELVFQKGRSEYGRAIISVKAGKNVGPSMIRDLKGVVTRERADAGIFVCVNEPTREMRVEMQTSGRIDLPGGTRHKIQIVTVKDLISGLGVGIPTRLNSLQAAEAARKIARKLGGRSSSKKDLQKEPPLPPMVIKGGRGVREDNDVFVVNRSPETNATTPVAPRRKRKSAS